MREPPIQWTIKLNIFFPALFFLINSSFAQTPVVGSKAPEIIFSKSLNKKIPTDYLKGKVIILDFWTTWCGPCIASFPEINKLVEKYKKNPDVVFVAISYEPAKKVEDFFIKRKKVLDALKLIDRDSLTNKRFGVNGFPHTIIIDKKGIVRWRGCIDSLNPAVIDNILLTEYVKTSNPEVKVTNAAPLISLSQSLLKHLDSINSQPGMQFITRTIDTPASTRYNFYDPGKVSGKFCINFLGQKLLPVISAVTASQRKASITTINGEKGNLLTDIIFKVETGYFNTPEFDAFENMYFEKSREVNFFICSMAKKYNFECRIKNKEFETYELSINDSVVLKNFLTLSSGGVSRSNNKNGVLEVSNYDLKSVFKELMKKDIIVSGLENMTTKFDLTLDMNNIDTLKKSFALQGFSLISKGKIELPVFEIEFE